MVNLFNLGKKLLTTGTAAASNVITGGIEALTGKEFGRTSSEELLNNPITNTLAGAGVVTATALAGTGIASAVRAAGGIGSVSIKAAQAAAPVVSSVAQTAIKNPVKTVLGAGFIAGGGLKLAQPLFETSKKATETAVPIITGEKNITEASPSDFKDVGKVAGIIAGSAVVGAGAGIIIPKIVDAFSNDDIPTIPEIKSEVVEASPTVVTEAPKTIQDAGQIAAPSAPVTPETQAVTAPSKTSKKKRSSKRKAPRRQNISQKVNVIVQNKNIGTTKRYLNIIPIRK